MSDNKINTFKERPITIETENQPQKPEKKIGKFLIIIRRFIGGEFFIDEKVKKNHLFLLFVIIIAIVYIANISYAEQKSSDIYKVKKELQELQLEYAPIKTKMTILEKQSVLRTKLKDSTIKESIDPIRIIKIEEVGDEE